MTFGEKEPVLNASNRTIKAILNDQNSYKNTPPTEILNGYRINHLEDVFADGSKLFTTYEKSYWLLRPPPSEELLPITPTKSKLNGAGSELQQREHFQKIKHASELEQLHRGYILFVLANWYLIRDQLYKPEENNNILQNKEYSFVAGEIDFTDYWILDNNTQQNKSKILNCGQADVIFDGPSGLTILELTASTVDKTKQLSKHRKGANQVIEKHNHPQILPINTFVGQVNLESKYIELAFKAQTSEIIYQYDNAAAVQAKTYNQALTIFNSNSTH